MTTAPRGLANSPSSARIRRRLGAFAVGWGWQGWAAIGYVLLHAAWMLLDRRPAAAREAIGNAFFAPVGLAMAAMAWMNARDEQLRPRARRGWRCLAAAYLILWIGSNLWAVNDLFLGRGRITQAVVDAGSLAFIVVLTIGLLSFGPANGSRSARVRLSLDFTMVGIGATMFVWYFMLRPRVVWVSQLDWTNVPSLISPAGELVSVLAIVLVLMRGTDRRSAVALRIIGAGQLLNVVGDSIYTPLAVAGTYRGGHPVDLLWMTGNAIMFLGAAHQYHDRGLFVPASVADEERHFARLPYLFILGGYIPILVASQHWTRNDRLVLYGTVGLTLGIVARQVIALRENAQLDRERRLQEARFRSLVQHSSDTVTIVDENGIVRYQSASGERLLGYPPQYIVGEPLAAIVHPADTPSVDALLAEAQSREHTRAVRWRACNQMGDWVQLETIATNLLADPAIRGVVLTSRDVSERVALESQLLQAQKMEAVGRLAGGIAHDFNNLLTAIRMTAALVAEELPAGSPLAEEVREIEASVDRGASLTRQLLAFSKKELIQPTLIDVAEVVAGIEPMIRRLVAKEVTLDIRATLQPWRVLADRGQLEQIVLNLALNARDAMPEHGTLTIAVGVTSVDVATARANPGLLPGEYVTLTVRDTGCGMTAEVQAHLFEPFFTTKAVGKGTGLGLSTVYAIVQQYGGAISVRSAPGEGASFTIYLPRAVSESISAEPRRGETGGGGGGRETILVVDDEESVRIAVRRILQKYGYDVLVAVDGAQALEMLRREEHPIALLLTDMVMPVMSGRELVEHAAREYPDLRIVVMSGHTEDPSLRQGQLATEHAFVAKPFTVSDLSATIRRVIDGTPASKTDATPAGASTG